MSGGGLNAGITFDMMSVTEAKLKVGITPCVNKLDQLRARDQRKRPAIIRQSRRMFRPRRFGPGADRITAYRVHAASLQRGENYAIRGCEES